MYQQAMYSRIFITPLSRLNLCLTYSNTYTVYSTVAHLNKLLFAKDRHHSVEFEFIEEFINLSLNVIIHRAVNRQTSLLNDNELK